KEDNKFLTEAQKIIDARGAQKEDAFGAKIEELYTKYIIAQRLQRLDVPFLVPPKVDRLHGKNASDEAWLSVLSAAKIPENREDAIGMYGILKAYADGNVAEFNRGVALRAERLEKIYPEVAATTGLEVFFNRFAPYEQSAFLFVVVLAMTFLSWF